MYLFIFFSLMCLFSGDQLTVKKKKMLKGLIAEYPTVYHFPPLVWMRASQKIRLLADSISQGNESGEWTLSAPGEFQCPYGLKRFSYYLLHETYDKTGSRFIGIKKGRPMEDKEGIFYFHNTGPLLDESEWWAIQRNMPQIRQQLESKKKRKLPENEKEGVQCCWNYKDECFLCCRSRSFKGVKSTQKGAVECSLCKRFFTQKAK